MLVRSWAGFVAPACCVCWACSHGVGCLSGSPCAIRVRSRLRCCCGAVVVAVRGCPQGCVVCVVCASNRVRVLLYPVVILHFVCTSTSALSFVVSLPFEVRERSEHRRGAEAAAARWAVRAAEGLEPCPRPWVPSYYARPIDIVQIHRSKTKPSDAMVRRATNLEHRPPPTARQIDR